MLINCSECGREVSDKAKACPHCGNPINSEIKKNNALSHMPCPKCGANWHTFDDNDNDVCKVCNHIFTEKETSNFEAQQIAKQHAIQSSKPKCPHCQSTNIAKISGAERTMSVIGLGILSKKINKSFKCKSCGYTW